MIRDLLAAMMALQCFVAPVLTVERGEERQSTPAEGTPIALRDDSAIDSSFVRFRGRLITAARTGDVQELIAMMPSSVRVDSEPVTPRLALAAFGVVKGHPWNALLNALELGVAKNGDLFVAPYLVAMRVDMDRAAVVGRNVRMRSEPRSDAAILTTLSMEWVALDRTHVFNAALFHRSSNPQEEAAWARVVASGGKTGYVYGKFVWAADHLRFIFEKVDDEWKLTRLAEGD